MWETSWQRMRGDFKEMTQWTLNTSPQLKCFKCLVFGSAISFQRGAFTSSRFLSGVKKNKMRVGSNIMEQIRTRDFRHCLIKPARMKLQNTSTLCLSAET